MQISMIIPFPKEENNPVVPKKITVIGVKSGVGCSLMYLPSCFVLSFLNSLLMGIFQDVSYSWAVLEHSLEWKSFGYKIVSLLLFVFWLPKFVTKREERTSQSLSFALSH